MSLKITSVFVFVIAFSLMASLPSSYSETAAGEYLMQGVGYGISKNIVEVADVQIQLKIDENQEATFEEGRILLDTIIHTIKNMDLSFYGGTNKLFKIDGTTDDDLKITGTGKLVLLNQNGMVYEIRGVITKQNFTEKIILYVSVQPSKEVLFGGILQEQEPVFIPTTPTTKQTLKKDLIVLVKQTFRNYWNDDYKISVKIFDKKLNPNPDFEQFSGVINNANITVNLSLPDGSGKKTITGKTQNGLWEGKQYFRENLDKPGKYAVNVVAKDGDSSVSQNYEMFLFATVLSPSGSNHPPIANAGPDQSVGTTAAVTLDGSGSSDPDGDTITYSWVQTSGTGVTLSSSTVSNPTFTSPNAASTLIFELTVSDGRTTATDTVTITVS